MRIIIGLAGLVAIVVAQGCTTPGDQPAEASVTQIDVETYMPREGLSAQQRLQEVLDLLERGNPEAARTELTIYLEDQPNNAVGRDLMRQIDLPALDYFPEDSREVSLRAGQSLSYLSQHYLGSLYRFYALAKYNGFVTPRSVKAGQTVRIPLTKQAQEVFAAADAARDKAAASLAAPQGSPPGTTLSSSEPEPVDIDQLHSDALSAYRIQDLDTAIALWDRVLADNPNHENARLYRAQALELQKKLSGQN